MFTDNFDKIPEEVNNNGKGWDMKNTTNKVGEKILDIINVDLIKDIKNKRTEGINKHIFDSLKIKAIDKFNYDFLDYKERLVANGNYTIVKGPIIDGFYIDENNNAKIILTYIEITEGNYMGSPDKIDFNKYEYNIN